MLVRYWFMFKNIPPAEALSLGCGVTAFSKEDALEMIRSRVFANKSFEVSEIIENVDVSKITDLHIRPNMGIPVVRGIWFPLGFQ